MELDEQHRELLVYAYEGGIYDLEEGEEAAVDDLVGWGLIEPDEDEFQIYKWDITSEGADLVEDEGWV